MNIFEQLRNRLTENRLNRLRRDLNMIQKNEYEWNPFKIGMPRTLVDTERDNFELAENIIWLSANGSAIREFYVEDAGKFIKSSWDNRNTYFARTCPNNTRYVHSGIPKLISECHSANVFGNGYSINVNSFTTENEFDEERSNRYTEALKMVLDENTFDEKLLRSGTWESGTGDIAWKLSFDFNLSYMPILEVFDRRNYSVVTERGIVTAIDFKSYYEKRSSTNEIKYFTYVERYTTDVDGKALIINKLYLKAANGENVEVPLTTIEETRALGENGLEQIKLDYNGMLAWHKKNKEYTGVMANYPYGSSDFSSKDNFDAIDEALSQIISEIRDNKTIRMWDERLLKKDDNGNYSSITGYVTNYIMYRGSDDQNAQQLKEYQTTDKTEQHIKKFQTAIELACSDCSISPISLGLRGDVALSSSDETIREKSKISSDTAAKKKVLWKKYLEDVLPSVIEFARYLTTFESYPTSSRAMAFKDMISDLDTNVSVKVTMNPFEIKTTEQKLTIWAEANQKGICSVENAIEKIYGNELTPDEKLIEVNRIKYERNMSVDSPELLNLTEDEEE